MEGRSLEKISQNRIIESNYDARTNYLNIMKQFMAHTNDNSQGTRDQNLEEYFQYEKELSQYIQEMLNHCVQNM